MGRNTKHYNIASVLIDLVRINLSIMDVLPHLYGPCHLHNQQKNKRIQASDSKFSSPEVSEASVAG